MRFSLDGICSIYCIEDNADGCFISNGQGYVMEADQMIEVGKRLIATAKKKGVKQDITEHNINNKIKLERKMTEFMKTPKQRAKSHVYLMKCADKYKIGVSNNVEQRKKQLDRRPFPIEIIAVSPLFEGAYICERELQEAYKHKRIDGEWFDLSPDEIREITQTLEIANEIYD